MYCTRRECTVVPSCLDWPHIQLKNQSSSKMETETLSSENNPPSLLPDEAKSPTSQSTQKRRRRRPGSARRRRASAAGLAHGCLGGAPFPADGGGTLTELVGPKGIEIKVAFFGQPWPTASEVRAGQRYGTLLNLREEVEGVWASWGADTAPAAPGRPQIVAGFLPQTLIIQFLGTVNLDFLEIVTSQAENITLCCSSSKRCSRPMTITAPKSDGLQKMRLNMFDDTEFQEVLKLSISFDTGQDCSSFVILSHVSCYGRDFKSWMKHL